MFNQLFVEEQNSGTGVLWIQKQLLFKLCHNRCSCYYAFPQTWPFQFQKGPIPTSFCLFLYFSTTMFKEICRFQSYSNSGCRSRKHTDHLTTTTAHGHANLTYSVTICFILPCKEMFFLYLCLSLHIPFINFNLYNLSCLPILSIKIISWYLLLLTSKSYLPTTCFSLSICLYIFPHSHTHSLSHS